MNIGPDHQTCKTCGKTKPVSKFHEQARSKTGYASNCRTCVNEKRRNKKAGPPRTSTRLNTLVKKGDVDAVTTLIAQATGPRLSSLLVTCVTPYLAHPKCDAHVRLAHFLLGQGADPDATNSEGERAVILATRTGFAELVDTLLLGGATVDVFSAAATLNIAKLEGFAKKGPVARPSDRCRGA